MREHISPVLSSLHWLPVKHRITYKTLTYVYKALHGLAPEYIVDLLVQPVRPGGRHLRSDDQMNLRVPWTNLKKLGGRAFAAVAPALWNKLPLEIKSANTLDSFRKHLKTHLFTVTS